MRIAAFIAMMNGPESEAVEENGKKILAKCYGLSGTDGSCVIVYELAALLKVGILMDERPMKISFCHV